METNQPDIIADIGFSGLSSNRNYFTNIILEYLRDDNDLLLLEIGCGDGKQLYELATKTSKIKMIGIDLSPKNTLNAQSCIRAYENRIKVFCENFISLSNMHAYFLIADSVMQNIDSLPVTIFQKLSEVVSPSGIAIISIPEDCIYNRILFLFRKLAALIRCDAFEQIILRVAKIINKNISIDQLRERIPYLFRIPSVVWNRDMKCLLATNGFNVLNEIPYPHSSIAQPKHITVVLQKK